MPKVRGTQKQRALELLDLVKRGPSFSDIARAITKTEAEAVYKAWSESWIVHELVALVPELKGSGK